MGAEPSLFQSIPEEKKEPCVKLKVKGGAALAFLEFLSTQSRDG